MSDKTTVQSSPQLSHNPRNITRQALRHLLTVLTAAWWLAALNITPSRAQLTYSTNKTDTAITVSSFEIMPDTAVLEEIIIDQEPGFEPITRLLFQNTTGTITAFVGGILLLLLGLFVVLSPLILAVVILVWILRKRK